MKKYSYSLAIISLLLSFSLFGQDWRVMMNDPKYNVHDVQKAFYKWYAAEQKHNKAIRAHKHDGDEEEEQNGAYTQFKRWEWFYKSRTFPSGNRPNPAVLERDYNNYLAGFNK